MEVDKPPERRAPSSRASKGNRMGRLIQEEEEEGDTEFYQQEFWNEAEGDVEYDAADEDDAGVDSFDSDFGASDSDSDDDEEEDEKRARKAERVVVRKKSVYVDPSKKKASAGSTSTTSGVLDKSRKRQRSEAAALAQGAPVFERGSLRASTQEHTAAQAAKRERDVERAKVREERRALLGKTKGIELVRLTQEEILAEAKQTEIINRASLEKMQQLAEENREKVIVRERDASAPVLKWRSKRSGDHVINTLTLVNCEVPDEINGIAPPYPPPQRCAVTGQPAKFFDPVTNQPYATLEAFRMLRGRTGRRSSWPAAEAGGGSSGLPGAQ